jgi:hypothetical protein
MKWRDVIITVILLALAFIIGAKCSRVDTGNPPVVLRDTVVKYIHVRDTVILTETRQISRIDTVLVEVHGDTVKVPVSLPFELKTYKTENYSLDISGYKPQLERIEITQKVQTITERVTNTVIKPPKWQVGAVSGIGYYGSAAEYIGIRGRYNYGRLNVEGVAGYSPSLECPIIEARVGFDIIKR